jgi:hypothetical protein
VVLTDSGKLAAYRATPPAEPAAPTTQGTATPP